MGEITNIVGMQLFIWDVPDYIIWIVVAVFVILIIAFIARGFFKEVRKK